jgi:hypothetical protein
MCRARLRSHNSLPGAAVVSTTSLVYPPRRRKYQISAKYRTAIVAGTPAVNARASSSKPTSTFWPWERWPSQGRRQRLPFAVPLVRCRPNAPVRGTVRRKQAGKESGCSAMAARDYHLLREASLGPVSRSITYLFPVWSQPALAGPLSYRRCTEERHEGGRSAATGAPGRMKSTVVVLPAETSIMRVSSTVLPLSFQRARTL